MGNKQQAPNFGPHINTITYYFASAIKAMSGAADHTDHCYKTHGSSNGDAVKPKKGGGRTKKGAHAIADAPDEGGASVGSASAVDASQTTTGTQSANPSAAALETLPPPPDRDPLPLTSNKVDDVMTTLRPIRPHKWRVVNKNGYWSNGNRCHYIDVKVKPDGEWARLSIVAISMIPLHLVDIYNRKFEIRNSRLIVRVLVPSTIEPGSSRGTLEFVSTSWHNIGIRANHSFREKHSAVMLLTGDNFEGLVGFDDETKLFPVKNIITELIAGDNDAVMRLFILGYSGISNVAHKVPEMLTRCQLTQFYCEKVVDHLIDHFIHPSYEALVRLKPGSIETYDLVEDFQNSWSRVEWEQEHAARWNLSPGDFLVRELDESEFDVNDNSMQKEIAADMYHIGQAVHNPPDIEGLSDEEKQRRMQIRISGPLLDSFVRTVFRLTKFSSNSNELFTKMRRDHKHLVLGIPLVPDHFIHDAVRPPGHPRNTPINDLSLWHHRRAGEIVQGPSPPCVGASNNVDYLAVNARGLAHSGGTYVPPPTNAERVQLYSDAQTVAFHHSPSPARPIDETRRGTWILGGPGHTDSVFGESTTQGIRGRSFMNALSLTTNLNDPGSLTIMGGNHTYETGDQPVSSPMDRVILTQTGVQRLVGSDTEMEGTDGEGGNTTAGGSGTDTEGSGTD